MKSATAESRSIEHQLVSNMALMGDDRAAGYRRALITAAAKDLVWRDGRAAAAEALYAMADWWATADLAETQRLTLYQAPENDEAEKTEAEKQASPAWRVRLRAWLPSTEFDGVAAILFWLSGFAAGAMAMLGRG